jgi:hypothetical protein
MDVSVDDAIDGPVEGLARLDPTVEQPSPATLLLDLPVRGMPIPADIPPANRLVPKLAAIKPKANANTGRDEPWELKDLRKTCATYYDEHMPESSIEILGHSVGGITYRHYAHRAPLAFKAIMTLPQPMAFTSLAKGFDGECPCCRRKFSGPDS